MKVSIAHQTFRSVENFEEFCLAEKKSILTDTLKILLKLPFIHTSSSGGTNLN